MRDVQAERGGGPVLSLVVPMYNEAEVARETVRRLLAAGEETGLPFEVLGVDDGSADGTAEILRALRSRDPRVRCAQLARNSGHFAATQAGLGHARGEMIVVLDADLQTPPELVPGLVDALRSAPPETVAVFGVTSKRDDPMLLLVGQAVFFFIQTRLSRHPIPHGASSFFIIRREVARRIASLPLRSGNVGAVVSALGLGASSILYDKPASYRNESRLGLKGYLREALGSMALTGVLSSLAGLGAAVLAAGGAAALVRSRQEIGLPALGAAALLGMAAAGADVYARRALLPDPDVTLPVRELEALGGEA